MFRKDDPCDGIKGPAKQYCEHGTEGGPPPDVDTSEIHGPIETGVKAVRGMAEELIDALTKLLAPDHTWAPRQADSWVYQQFLWLGQHLAVAIFICVVVVCALTAWQGTPRLKQLGASTGWTLAAVAGMASVPGAVMLLNEAVSAAFTAAFDSNATTLFGAITEDMEKAVDAGNPLSILLILAALVVALAFAALVFMSRQLGILAFVCLAPVVLASLARGGDTSAVKAWAQRLLGLMFAPFALLIVSPFVQLTKGALVMDALLLVAADVLMLRMIFHGVPYFGPKVAGAARSMVESKLGGPLPRAVMRAGVPDVYEQETVPRGPRTVDTPRRAMTQDGGTLAAAYGIKRSERPARLTTASASAKIMRDTARTAQLTEARRQARAAQRSTPRNPQTATQRPVPAPGPTGQPPAPPANP
ncbi:hypothetical protein [Streptomyces sp. NPDC057381]|uniref:hypothetical protein n=1 Tax=Streptomyces sp. NPDC057381 TaxID=3346111 RepID=UPI00362560DF